MLFASEASAVDPKLYGMRMSFQTVERFEMEGLRIKESILRLWPRTRWLRISSLFIQVRSSSAGGSAQTSCTKVMPHSTPKPGMLLFSMVGITNIGATFPLTYCFITTESAASFELMPEALTMFVFYDCPEPSVIISDFSKCLGAVLRNKVG